MRLLAEAIPPVNPVTTAALAALFALCALIFAIGLLKLLDAFVRAMFGTVSGAIGWIPFAGRVVSSSLHKIEQKISHAIGSAERKLDAGVAWTWNNCAHLVAYVGTEIEGLAKGAWHIAQSLKGYVTPARLDHVVRANVKPVNAKAAQAAQAARDAQAGASMVGSYIATGVMPRIHGAEWEIDHVLEPSIAGLRARTRALEHGAIRTFDWIRAHPGTLAATAFAGAVAVALRKLGGGWIRCKNWRAIGSHVCGLPWQLIEALLGLGLAFAVVIDPRKTAKLAVAAEDAMESIIRKIAD